MRTAVAPVAHAFSDVVDRDAGLADLLRVVVEEMNQARAEAQALEDRAYRISKDAWGTTPRAQVAAD